MNQAGERKGNILAIDDLPENLRLLVNLLTQKGYKVRATPSGKLAIKGIHKAPPDLILLDIMMPEMNGYEVCEQLKADERTRNIPVIFLSAMNEVLDKVKAFSIGGIDYITKPFQAEEVLARVQVHLDKSFLQKSLQAKNEELAATLQQLKTTQEELIQSEKMAALGQLVAGVAHEVNTPLGAIRSSVENISSFLSENLEKLPSFFQGLSPEEQQYFLSLLQRSISMDTSLSSKEKRKYRRDLKNQIEAAGIANADSLASTLVNIGVYDEVQHFLPLLKDPESERIIKTAYQFATVQKSTRTIATATDRAAKVVYALKTYGRYDSSGQKVLSKIGDGIETVLTLYHNQIKQGVEVVRNYDESIPAILCYPDDLNQVWTNLVHNALQAMNNQGTIAIEVTRQDDRVRIDLTDSGPGIPADIQPKIFDPFFTTKPPGEGSGLGLDIVKKIIVKHEGTIELDSVPGKTTFTVYLPILE